MITLREKLQVNQVLRLRGGVAEFAKGDLAGDDFVKHHVESAGAVQSLT